MSDRNLILILGDQLSHNLPSLNAGDRNKDRILIAEVQEEASYVKHHKKKIIFLFSAMRRFADELRNKGWQVDYIKIDDPQNKGSLEAEVERANKRHAPNRILVTEPGEWRLLKAMQGWSERNEIPVTI